MHSSRYCPYGHAVKAHGLPPPPHHHDDDDDDDDRHHAVRVSKHRSGLVSSTCTRVGFFPWAIFILTQNNLKPGTDTDMTGTVGVVWGVRAGAPESEAILRGRALR